MSSEIVAAVDIGTSKTIVILGEIEAGANCNIIGCGNVTTQGVRKGEIVDIEGVRDGLRSAFFTAERGASVKSDRVFLAQSGAHLIGMAHTGKGSIRGPDSTVTERDIERARDDAKAKEVKDDRLFIHHIAQGYRIDGKPVEQPRGRQGSTLEACYWSIHASEERLRDMVGTVESLSLRVEDIIVASLASAGVTLRAEDKAAGALLLDIGAGTTDYVLYHKGHVATTGVIPVGGDHLTNDLSIGLRIGREYAEKLKISSGNLLSGEHQKEKVWLIGDQVIGDREVRREVLKSILLLRVEELFEVVKKSLHKAGVGGQLGAGVFLCGGTALLPGIEQVAGKVFGRPARVAELPAWANPALRDPSCATALGLLEFALKNSGDSTAGGKSKGLLGKVAQMFTG